MAIRSVSSFKSTKDTRYADNSAGAITAQNSRDTFEDTADSFVNWTDGIVSVGTSSDQFNANKVPNANITGAYRASGSISSALILTSNASPVSLIAAPGAGNIILPIMFFVSLDYNSAAYATNTSFRFEINGVAVSGTNSSILPGTADRYTSMLPVAFDTTTDMRNQPLVFETQTGNPTAGNSLIYYTIIYRIIPTLEEV